MSSTVTPPPPAPPAPYGGTPQPAPLPPRQGSGAGRVIAILVAVFGGLVILGAAGSAIFATIAAASTSTSSRTIEVSGVTELDLDVAAGSLRVEFTDVAEAELDVTSAWGFDRWTLRRDEDALVVASPQGIFGGGWLFGGSGDAVLRLPLELEGADADVAMAAGEFRADGAFGDLDLDLGAGGAEITGSAEDLDVQVSAGGADLELADVAEASLSVSAGSLDVTLTGSAPRAVQADVSAGTLVLTVPEGTYDVTSDVSAGEFDSRVDSSSGARNTIDVQVSAGQAILRAE